MCYRPVGGCLEARLVERALRWVTAAMAGIAAFLLAWWGLSAGWHWARGDAFGLSAVPFSVVLVAMCWWAALPLERDREEKELGEPAPDRSVLAEPIRFGAIPGALRVTVPRDDLLSRLTATREAGSLAVVCAVTGLRGVGKTQLAGEYARDRIVAGWPLVAWIDAEDTVQMLGQLVALAELVHLRRSEAEDAAVVTARLRDWLQARREPGLLVFDNAADPDAVAPYLPATGATQVVITSTGQGFNAFGELIQVGEFTSEQAASFLMDSTGLEDPDGAAAVAENLGRLPLALAHAAVVIAEHGLDYRTYLQRLDEVPLTEYLTRPDGHRYPRGTAPAILLSLAAVEERDPSGLCRRLMDLLAVLSPTGVSGRLLHWAVESDAGGPTAAMRVDAAIATLARASLVTRSDTGLITSHRLVMRVVRERGREEPGLVPVIRVAVGALARGMDEAGSDSWANRNLITEIVSHATALWDRVQSLAPGRGEDEGLAEEMLGLLLRALRYLLEIRAPTRAAALGTDLVQVCSRLLGNEHRDTLRSRHDLAIALREAGRLAEATALLEQNLAARERVLGYDHPDTLQSRHDLAFAYRDVGRLTDAVSLFGQTLAARERVLGSDHPDTLQSSADLAGSYRKAGRLTEAIALHQRTLAARQRALGAQHPAVLQSQHDLAAAYREAGRLAEATRLLEQTSAARELLLGEDHPDTLGCRNDLAGAYREAERFEEAIALHEQVLAARQRLLGESHPNTLRSRNNLAFAYRKAGRLAVATESFQQILADRERILGEDHPDTLRSRSNLAGAHREARRYSEAIALYEQALTVRQRVLGADNPDTLRSRSDLAGAYREAGRIDEAIGLHEQALAARLRVLGEDHPDTLTSQNNLALAYQSAGRVAEAIALFEQALANRERILGPEHPDTVRSRVNLARARRRRVNFRANRGGRTGVS